MEYILAIDIGGTFIKYGLIDENENLSNTDSFKTINTSLEDFVESLDKLYEEMSSKYDIKGVAISSPGSVDTKTRIIHGASALPFIHNNDWVNEFSKRHNVKLGIENDANCSALAEVYLGNAKECNNIVSLVIGTGLGGSVVINKQIVHGANLYGGEIGYMFSDIANPVKTVTENVSTNALFTDAGLSNGLEVFEKYDAGDEKIVEIVELYFKKLAAVMFNINHMLDPELILIGGGISKREDLVPKIKEYYKELQDVHSLDTVDLKLTTCKFNNDSNLIGAYINYKHGE